MAQLQLPARNLKLFAKALACLGKIGPELFLEVTDDGLNMQTLNQARSAFVIFRLTSRFFSSFQRTSDAPVKVQIQVKPCVAVFRAHASVDHCDVVLDTDTNCVIFVMHCKGGVQKKHRICMEDSNANKAMYSKITPNRIVSRARTLLDCVQNFHTSIEEITLVPQAHHLTLKSFVELDALGGAAAGGGGAARGGGAAGAAAKDAPSFLKTELVLDCNDFEEYAVKANAGEITFSLKELRAILAFSEAAGMPLSIYFSDPGQPILWSVNCFDALVVDFVLATMAPVGSAAGASQASAAGAPVSSSQAATGLSAPPSHSATPRGAYPRGSSPPARTRHDRSSFGDDDDDDDNGGGGANSRKEAAAADDERDYVEGTPERLERESKRRK